MKNTIFDYDSSGDEEELNKKPKAINNILVDYNILYKAGSAVLHNRRVLIKYKSQKNEIHYKSSPHSMLLNKFLTQEKHDNKDKTGKSLNSLLNYKYNNLEKKHDNIQRVVNSYKLYNQLKELALEQNEKAAIKTLKWACFTELEKHLDKTELNDTKSINDLGLAFGIRKPDDINTADEDKTKAFFDKIPKAINETNVKDIIRDLLKLELDPLLQEEVVSTIIDPITELDQINAKVNAIFEAYKKFQGKIDIVNKANTLYNQLKDLALEQNEKAAIKTLKWACFTELEKHLDKTELNDTKSINDLGLAFGIRKPDDINTADEDKTKAFFDKIPKVINKTNVKDIIWDLLSLVSQSTTLLNDEIEAHVISKKQTANFDFGIRILCDEQLTSHEEQSPSLSNQFSDFDSIVNDKIQELSFFNNSNDEQVNAKDFLACSLIYQKLLKTITKFTSLRTHGHEIDAKIQYNAVRYHNKDYPKVIDTKSKLSTGLKRTEEVAGLGNYNNISKMLQQVQEKLQLNNQQLIKAFQDVLKGKDLHNQYKTFPDAVKVLYDITYLLFSCEPNRNPEALISNAMFLELIKRGEYQITDMATKLPMAMSSGQNKKGAIEIGRYYHEQYEKQKADNRARKNDYGKSKLKDNSSEVEEFQEREQNLLKDFLGFNNWPIKPLLDVKKIKKCLEDRVNKNIHPEFSKKDEDAKALEEKIKLSTPDRVLDYLKELTFNKVKTGEQQKLENAKINAQKVVNNYDKELKKYEQDLDKINVKILIEINKLIKEWYGFDNVLTSNTASGTNHDADNGHFKGGSKKHNDNADDSDSNHSNEFDHKHKQNHGKQTQIDTNSHSNTNKYCSILVEKYENYQDSTSGIIDIQFQPLDYGSCAKIDNEALSKLQWIIDHKDPASRKRSYYEAFPEELHYSNVFEKRFKLSEYEVIKKYYMPYCLAVSESAIIERLVNSEFLFSHGEYNLYSKQYNSYNIGFIKKSLINAGLLNRDESQLNKEFDKWCKTDWDSTAMGAYKHFSQAPSNTTQKVYKSMVKDVHALDNAANKANSFSYQYQCSDIRYVGKQLFDNLKENINWIGDVGEGHIDLDASNLLPEAINKPVVGVYNIGNFHWIGFAIKKIGADFLVFYKDSLNNKEIDRSFKKLINKKYSEQGEILYFSHTGNEQTESKKTACGVFALKNACTIATKLNLNEFGANKETCEGEFDNIEFTKQKDIPTLRENYGNLYALEFTTQLQNSCKTNIIKEIIRASHDTDIETLIHSIKEKLQETNLNDVHFVKIKGNEVFDNYKNQARTIGIEVYLADQNLLSLENYQHFVQIHFSKDINQNTLLNQLNDLNLQNIPLSNLLGIVHEPTEEKKYSLSQAKLQSEQHLLEEAIQKKIESDIQEALGQSFNAKSFKVEKSIMTKKYHVEKEIQPLDEKIKIEIMDKTLDAFLKQWKLEIETKNQIKGVAKEGLTPDSININLDAIIEAKQDNTYFYVAPKIMNQEELLSSMDDWQNIPSIYYVALIKLENESGDKHAVLFQASKALDHLSITITDPLSQEASTFKLKIENLAESLPAEGRDIKVVYSGRQDKDYGTCGDMCLIMLQELIEQSANKPALNICKQIIVDNFIDINQINYENSALHNFEYANALPQQLAGDLAHLHLDY